MNRQELQAMTEQLIREGKNPVAEAILELAGALHRLGMGNADSQGRGAIEAHTMMVTETMTTAADTIADALREGVG
jgi:hypothetical protein